MEERVLVWAHARDARLTCGFLEDAGFSCQTCSGWDQVVSHWEAGFGALVVADELVTPSALAALEARLADEPPWSDPAVVIVGGEEEIDRLTAFSTRANVSLLQRPLSVKTLRSTVRAALRARRRQYQVRDLLQQKDEADKRKDEFLAMLAHELRNPLAPLRTGLELLRLGPRADVVARTYAMMERQLTNLRRLVDDLLDVSRITRRKIALQTHPLDLCEVARQTVDAMQPLARDKGLHLDAVLRTQPVTVNADPVRAEQMIGNLVSNAIKFTPRDGSVQVIVDTDRACAVLRVRDSGVGIPVDQLDRVFDLFAQAPRALDRSEGGLGIGLTVVKLLAELHGGRVGIMSGEGRGTEVVIRLPLMSAPDRRDEPASTGASRAVEPRRVLVVEDNPDVAQMLATYLEHLGHRVVVAYDGHAGLEAALRHRPHVLICDIGLPGLDGYQIAARLRSTTGFESCVMIAMTGYGEPADRERAHRAGFAHHLTKPADPMRVADLIGSLAPESARGPTAS